MKTLYKQAALLMAGVLALCLLLTALIGVQTPKRQQGLQVTASFYPIYVAALKVVGQTQGVSVQCLVQPQTGCVHDYAMTPQDMLRLQQSDVLILNGAGAEAFLQNALDGMPALEVVDTSRGIDLLCDDGHAEHGHSHEHEHLYNQHIWTSPVRYQRQVRNIALALANIDPAHAADYLANAEGYCAEVALLYERMQNAVRNSGYTKAVLFSTSLTYLAQDLGLQVLATVPIGEQSQATPQQLAAVQQAVQGKKVLFLYDDQYQMLYTELQQKAQQSRLLSLNTGVRGELSADAWLAALEQTAKLLEGGAEV